MIHAKVNSVVHDITNIHWIDSGQLKEIANIWQVVNGVATLVWQAVVRKLLNTTKLDNKTYIKN